MADYKALDVVGSSYRRGNKMTFFNYLNSVPSISIDEEEIYTLEINGGVQTIRKGVGSLTKEVMSYDEVVQLRSPMDGSLLDQYITYADIYQALYSLYWHLAEQRDASEILLDIPPEEPIVPPEEPIVPPEEPPEIP